MLDARNIDLRRKLRRRERKKSNPLLWGDRKCHIGRTYNDYQFYMAQNPHVLVSQMDSVVIHKGGQVILTDQGSELSDPMNSNQKSSCERNHELMIRYIIPKH